MTRHLLVLSLLVAAAGCRQEAPAPPVDPSAEEAALGAPRFAGAGVPAAAAPGDLVLGMSAAFTGPAAGLGIEYYRGASAYLAGVNDGGGVYGRGVHLATYDDRYEPTPAIQNTIRLVEQDGVFLLFGYVGTPTVTRVLPLLPRYAERGVFLFFPLSGAQPQRRPPYDRLIFNLRASYRQEVEGLVDHFVAAGRRRVAVFYQADAYGRSGWDAVRQALGHHGLELVAEATYHRNARFEESYRPQVEILRRGDPDAIVSVGVYGPCAGLIRDARQAGWQVPIANLSFVGSENLLQLLAPGDANGNAGGVLINSQVLPSYEQTELAAVREYRRAMERHAPGPPQWLGDDYQLLELSYVGFEGFLAAKLLVEILRRLGPDPEPGRLPATVEAMGSVDLGLDVPVVFGSERHQGLDRIYYTTFAGGRQVPLTDWGALER